MQRSRCMTKDDLINADCRKEFIQENKFLPIEVLKSDDLQDFTKVSLNAVQIRPQIVKMNLRKSILICLANMVVINNLS